MDFFRSFKAEYFPYMPDKEKDLWLTFEMPNLIPPKQYMVPILQDEILVAKVNKQKRNVT